MRSTPEDLENVYPCRFAADFRQMQPAEGFARIITVVQQSDIEAFLRYIQKCNKLQPPPQRSLQKSLHVRSTPCTHQHLDSESAAGAAQAIGRQDRRSCQWREQGALNGHNLRTNLSPQAATQLTQNSSGHPPSSVDGRLPEGDQAHGRPSVSSRSPAEAQRCRPSPGAGEPSSGLQHARRGAGQAANGASPAINVSAGAPKQPKSPSKKAKCAILLLFLMPRPGLVFSLSGLTAFTLICMLTVLPLPNLMKQVVVLPAASNATSTHCSLFLLIYGASIAAGLQ